MNKSLIAASLLALMSSSAMAANDWRFAAGADVWNAQGSGQISGNGASYDSNYNWNGYLQLEHGIILLPNAKFEMTDMSSSGGAFNNDLLAYDLSLYYRLFNNDLFKIDLGLTGRRYDGDFNTLHYAYDEDMLMAYGATEMKVPGTGLSAFADARVRDADNFDYRLGGAYKFSSAPVKVRAGWREAQIDFDRVDQNLDGWFVGAEFTF
ncbi:TIGR04219 family outer membrane beta-barrel protein [Aeromonas diversa]|uniref:TIGR04219 family outer membrane beta-barrel protein n=1 Tax=Aeromonas diversa TaxID=502790 RepID=UPI0039A2BD29